jgi:hypothetical protein
LFAGAKKAMVGPGGVFRSGMRIHVVIWLTAAWLACAVLPSQASPWAEVGDNQLRSDIELLRAAGVISVITIHWPLPWGALAGELDAADLSRQPASVRGAALRVLARARAGQARGVTASAYADATNSPSLVYGFDGMGRGDGQAQLSVSSNAGAFSARAALGLISGNFGGKPNKLMAGGSFASVDLGGWVHIYAGYLDHWWGPGQISALQLSNFARPMPQVGIERSSSEASSWPVLRWLGPWHFEFLLGKLDGPQKQSNVYYNAAHLTISPLPGLELGVAKTEEFCGQGHPCAPLRDYFQNLDFSNHPNNVNGESSFEFKYSNRLGAVPFEVHMQLMNEDYSLAHHAGASHLFGASVWLPAGDSPLKLTAEYADTIATRTFFGFGDNIYGFTFTDYQFPDGMHYRGRNLGFGLDTDSTLASVQASWSDAGGRFYELSLHHATISDAHSAGLNIVSPIPVKLNLAEARVTLPLALGPDGQGFTLDLAGRVQDDQPRPHGGFAAAIEAGIRIGL